jgi:hypothetical protein
MERFVVRLPSGIFNCPCGCNAFVKPKNRQYECIICGRMFKSKKKGSKYHD